MQSNSSIEIPFERFASRRAYYAFDFLPNSDGVLYSSNTSGQFNLWRQAPPIKVGRGSRSEAGPCRQLTGFDEWSVRNFFVDPKGKFSLVFADKDGDENYQLFLVDNEAGWQREVVMKPGVRNQFGKSALSPNGKFAAYSNNERNPRFMDIVLTRLSDGRTKHVLEGESTNFVGEWSPEGRYLTVAETTTAIDDCNILLLDTRTGKTKSLTPHDDKSLHNPGPWDPKGNGFYLTSNEGREFLGIAYIETKGSKEPKLHWIETPDHDIDHIALSPNGRIFAWESNEDGYSFIHLKDLRTGKLLGKPISTGGVLSPGWIENTKTFKFSPDGKKILFLLTTPTQPTDLYVLRVADRKITRFSYGFIGNIPERILVNPKLIAYESFDGKAIPAFLYRPKTKTEGSDRIPAVIWVHGGPESQEQPGYLYAGAYQYLLSRGIAILAPNFRGSTGYGRSYRRLIHHDWGGAELKDIEYAAKYLQSTGSIDPNHIGITGASFGGFTTLGAVTRLPEYWSVGVDVFGPSNLVTMAKSFPEFWKPWVADFIGDPESEMQFLLERSPITYIQNVRCPILIVQGANDPRVVKNESDQIVEKLREMQREVEYIVFPDEGHGFTKRKNEFVTTKAACNFLVDHLVGERAKKAQQQQAIPA